MSHCQDKRKQERTWIHNVARVAGAKVGSTIVMTKFMCKQD